MMATAATIAEHTTIILKAESGSEDERITKEAVELRVIVGVIDMVTAKRAAGTPATGQG